MGVLAAGAAITGMLSSPGTAIKGAILSRGLAELITMQGVRRWLSNTRQHQMSAKGQARLAALSPQVFGLSAAALAENSDLQAAMEWLNEGVSQIDDAGRRAIRPPEGAESWEEFFDR